MSNRKKVATEVQQPSVNSQIISLKEFNLKNEPIASKQSFAVWMRALTQNWRQGTVACKGRSDVAFSNKKPWKQKGTGRARAGSPRSPLWRKGGVIFGPQMRTRTLALGKKQKHQVLKQIVTNFINNKNLIMVDWMIEGERPSATQAAQLLKQLNLAEKKVMLLLPTQDMQTYASFVNIPRVYVTFYDELNAYYMSRADHIVFLKKDLPTFKEMVSKWS